MTDYIYVENSHKKIENLTSDPATCVGCRGFKSNISICRELRADRACQKQLVVLTHAITLAIRSRRESDALPIIRMLAGK